jgi:hypothetical protein
LSLLEVELMVLETFSTKIKSNWIDPVIREWMIVI